MPTPGEQAKIEKERTISDAELLKGGAEYVVDENGEKILSVTIEQCDSLEKEHADEQDQELGRRINDVLEALVVNGDSVSLTKFFYLNETGISEKLQEQGIETDGLEIRIEGRNGPDADLLPPGITKVVQIYKNGRVIASVKKWKRM